MSEALRVGLDTCGPVAYFAALEPTRDGAVLRAAGAIPAESHAPRAILGAQTRMALAPGEALASSLPGMAIEEAEEAFRWEVAKSGIVPQDADRVVIRRAQRLDTGPPFLGFAADPRAAAARTRVARALGLTPTSVVVEALAFERLLVVAGKFPTTGAVIHVDVREGTSVLSAYGAGGLALRRTVRSAPISPDDLAIDVQRSVSYAERKLSLPPAEAVYFTGEGVDPALAEAVARGLPGLRVEALDPLELLEIDPKLDMTTVGALAYALALPIGLALLEDSGPPDFLPPAERDARVVRRAISRMRTGALLLAPLVMGVGLLAQQTSAPARVALREAEAKVAKVELLEKRAEELQVAVRRTEAWRTTLRSLGDRPRAASALLLLLATTLPGEAYLTDIDARGRGEDLEIRVRGELIAPDQSSALSARDPLRKAANEVAPGAQVVFDTARMVQGRVRIGFSIDGVAPGAPPPAAPATPPAAPGGAAATPPPEKRT